MKKFHFKVVNRTILQDHLNQVSFQSGIWQKTTRPIESRRRRNIFALIDIERNVFISEFRSLIDPIKKAIFQFSIQRKKLGFIQTKRDVVLGC